MQIEILTVYVNYTMLMQPKYSPVVEKVPIQSSQLEFNLSLFKFEAETSPSKIMIQFCGLFLPQLSPQIMLFLSYSNSVVPQLPTQIQLFLSYLLEFSCSSVTQFHLYLSYSNPLHTRHFHFSLRIAFISLVPQIFFFGSFLYFHSSNHFLSLLNSSSSSSYPLS